MSLKQLSVVNEPSVFKPLKFYYNYKKIIYIKNVEKMLLLPLHSESPKLYTILAFLSAIVLITSDMKSNTVERFLHLVTFPFPHKATVDV